MYLLDTNCWMEVARSRPGAGDIVRLLASVPARHLFVSIYSVHSIGVLLQRHRMPGRYAGFLSQMAIGTGVGVVAVPVDRLGLVDDACAHHKLDFDDAYQYATAELNNLTVVSYDSDFDRTPRGRLDPLAALAQYQASQPKSQNP